MQKLKVNLIFVIKKESEFESKSESSKCKYLPNLLNQSWLDGFGGID